MRVVLISTYDLGRQPFGLASPAAWLREEGFEVDMLDLAVEPFDEVRVSGADLVAFHLPMHTATRIAARLVPRVRALQPAPRLCCYGLYAPTNQALLRRLGVVDVLGPEFESDLVALARRLRDRAVGEEVPAAAPGTTLPRLAWRVPDRSGLPELSRYAHLHDRDGRRLRVGATDASRGCKHRCRHCPIVPVYEGRFRVVSREVVLEDVRRQVAAGAEHITFGDPDFFNGIGHAVPLVEALHAEHPTLGYDVTIKVEHLLRHHQHLATLRDTGCRFVTTAVESVDDRVLEILDKGHTRADFVEVVRRFRAVGLVLNPTFVAFTPWIDRDGYRDLLATLEELELVEHVAPIQLAIRLLIPSGSKLLELSDVRERVGTYDESALVHPWRHPDPEMDALQREIQALVESSIAGRERRASIFARVADRAGARPRAERGAALAGRRATAVAVPSDAPAAACVPYLTEPWYC